MIIVRSRRSQTVMAARGVMCQVNGVLGDTGSMKYLYLHGFALHMMSHYIIKDVDDSYSLVVNFTF